MNVPASGRSRPLRVLLLALMLSPLTHPFSTVDVGDVFGDPAPHETVPAAATPASEKLPAALPAAAPAWRLAAVGGPIEDSPAAITAPGAPRETPLRI